MSDTHLILMRQRDEAVARAERLLQERNSLARALELAIQTAALARQEWDTAPSGMRAGKILIALSGGCPGYRGEIDEIHSIRKAVKDFDQ